MLIWQCSHGRQDPHDPLLLHQALKSFTTYRLYLAQELEANYLAGALLVDEQRFVQALEDTMYDLDKLVAKFDVSYETVAHRFAAVGRNMNIHFIKVASNGKIVKRFSRSGVDVDWLGIEHICRLSACWLPFERNENFASQISRLIETPGEEGEEYFCFSRKVRKPEDVFTVTIGIKAKEALGLKHYKDHLAQGGRPTKVSKLSCPCHLRLSPEFCPKAEDVL